MTQPQANQAQAELWNNQAGQNWVEQNAMLDRLLAPFEQPLVEAVQGARDVLDVGCGAGATTFAVARSLGGQGRCTGLDLSVPLVELARRRAVEMGADNTDFVVADAQLHAFQPARFDAVISRFGVMFFDDPVAAFANLRRAALDDARLAMIAWRGMAANPFMTAAERAAAPLLPEAPPRDPNAPGQFAFADPDRVAGILSAAGWRDVDLAPLDLACVVPAQDLEIYATRMGPVSLVLPSLEPDRRHVVIAAVRRGFEPFVSDGVARFTAACWMIKARNSD
ncbi:class I SAM-dependent methyltransferase [Caulobacter sp. UNC279MFTsu5.1]|uniref:class I SAM-dependent methyltransferase n=1 Tax=Caulobacter sp. UNC279MFTsu5.1 TaxID=1502775 RepID=UPI0008EE0A45|nr:methyltransferase domain-containing protein [Caulobacter sp. UNC279MFTsu5.1]SFJ17614.1 Ubiquinone/menaquinone biosynthesis C-methylase UbiE [Caulobacter sp. UNC279MFTsu5.1]